MQTAKLFKNGRSQAVGDGDTIVIEPGARTLNLDVPDAEIAKRLAHWRKPRPSWIGPRQVDSTGVVGAGRPD